MRCKWGKCVAAAAADGPRLWRCYLLTPWWAGLYLQNLCTLLLVAALRNIAHWRRIVPVNRIDRHRYSVHSILRGYWRFRVWVDWWLPRAGEGLWGNRAQEEHVCTWWVCARVRLRACSLAAQSATCIELYRMSQCWCCSHHPARRSAARQSNCIKEDAAQSGAWNEPLRSLKLYRHGEVPIRAFSCGYNHFHLRYW